MARNINVAVFSGNLTRDPELKSIPNGTTLVRLRVATNSRRKQGEEWVDRPNYLDVTAWGALAENCARYLQKGSGIVVDAEIEYEEWTDKETQKMRSAVRFRAKNVQFTSAPREQPADRQATPEAPAKDAPASAPADESDGSPSQPLADAVEPAPAGAAPEEDLPF